MERTIWPNVKPRTDAQRKAEHDYWRDEHKAWALLAVDSLPRSFHGHLAAAWDARYGIPVNDQNGSPVARANRFVAEAVRDFGDARVADAYDEAAIRDYAENYAQRCAKRRTLEERIAFAARYGIAAPAGKGVTAEGACRRLDDPLWWRRQLRKVWTRRAEDAMRRAGIIRKGKAVYASEEAVRHRRGRQRRTREWLESRVMVNGEGEQLKLLELHDKSLANPALRRGEFMCRMRGFEEVAKDLDHVALFFTLTAPSAFHAQLAAGGVNPAYQRDTVRDAQAWLRRMWSRARAEIARLSIQFYGFRIAEPHHDGTPHWHMVLFVAPHHADTLARVIRARWLSEFKDERGAEEFRCKCITIDPEQGSATGYVAKYVSKNIDGAGAIGAEISDETGGPVADSVERVAAWASCHGIRQFQQLGGPPVGLWRECRRARTPHDAERIERARVDADRGDWRGFIGALGGVSVCHRRVRSIREKYTREVRPPMIRALRLAKRQWRTKHGPRMAWERRPARPHEMPAAWLDKMQPRRADAQGREVLAETRYGEAAGERPAGVVAVGLLGRWACLETRPHRWRIQRDSATASHSGVMNPPQSAARGCEAGNPIALNAVGDFMAVEPASREISRRGEGDARPAAPISFRSGFLPLGPVAITVRGTDSSAFRDYSWIATVPFRPPRPGTA